MSRVHEALTRARGTVAETPEGGAAADRAGVPLFPLEGQDSGSGWASESKEDADRPLLQPGPAVAPSRPPAAAPAAPKDNFVLDEPVRRLGERLVLAANPDQGSVEQYRNLAGRLHLAQAEHGTKVVMIASALPGEGKSLTAANLALTLSESYHRNVLLIDGDLRRPSVHEMFQIPNLSGLNEGLRSDSTRKVPLVRWSDHLTLITAGRPDSDPMKVLVSEKMRKVISEAVTKYEWIIIDTPPIGLLTDASLLSAMVDTAVLVVEAGRTPCADVQRAIQALGRDRIFGVVLNKAEARKRAGYVPADYNYGSMVKSF